MIQDAFIDEEFVSLLCRRREINWNGRFDFSNGWKFQLVVYNYSTMRMYRVELDDTMTQQQAADILKVYGVDFGQSD